MTRSIKSMLVILGATFAFALQPAPVAHAEVTLDVSKLTCEQFLGYCEVIALEIVKRSSWMRWKQF